MIDASLNIIPRSDLQLYRIGDKTILIDISANNIDFTDVYSMNETAIWMWEQVTATTQTAKSLECSLFETYDITEEQAHKDIEAQLKEWVDMGLITLEEAHAEEECDNNVT